MSHSTSSEEVTLIKLTGYDSVFTEDIIELFPAAKIIFSCRTPKPCIASKTLRLKEDMKLRQRWKYPIFSCKLPSTTSGFAPVIIRAFMWRNPGAETEIDAFDGSDCAIIFAYSVLQYKRNRGHFDACVLYEDLVANPETTLKSLLDAINVRASEDDLLYALTALKEDSQVSIQR